MDVVKEDSQKKKSRRNRNKHISKQNRTQCQQHTLDTSCSSSSSHIAPIMWLSLLFFSECKTKTKSSVALSWNTQNTHTLGHVTEFSLLCLSLNVTSRPHWSTSQFFPMELYQNTCQSILYIIHTYKFTLHSLWRVFIPLHFLHVLLLQIYFEKEKLPIIAHHSYPWQIEK